MEKHHQSSDEERMPQASFKRQRGWQGEHLELNHSADACSAKEAVVAVDLNQFRNTVVGQGYQAKHVIRQKGLTSAPVSKVTIDKGDDAVENKKQRKSTEYDSRQTNSVDQAKGKSKLQAYLKCEGLRKFRKELAKIEASA
jgi:hypothetical protein